MLYKMLPYSCIERFPVRFYFCSCEAVKPKNLTEHAYAKNCIPVSNSGVGVQSKQMYVLLNRICF